MLQLRGVTRHVGERPLLCNISLTISPGDRISVSGPSGSGKTLLLRLIGLLDPFTAGKLTFAGQTIHGASVPNYRRNIVYLHQQPSLTEGTVEYNLRRPFEFRANADRFYDRRQAVAWLQQLDRDESFLSKRYHTLSGGEQQLSAIIRALLLQPKVLLLDEPTSALDLSAIKSFEQLIQGWINEEENRAYVLVTHDPEQARRLCRQHYRLENGTLSSATSESG